MFLNKINAIAQYQENYRKVSEMIIDQDYIVLKLQLKETRYGGRIMVQLQEFGFVFLPPRIYNTLADDQNMQKDMKDLIDRKKLGVRYLGGRFNAVEFIDL